MLFWGELSEKKGSLHKLKNEKKNKTSEETQQK
jgi:hypothetical protein